MTTDADKCQKIRRQREDMKKRKGSNGNFNTLLELPADPSRNLYDVGDKITV